MIYNLNGDLLKSKVNIICHQVNCVGIMGGGIAKSIKEIYPNTFNIYKNYCEQNLILGTNLITVEDDCMICNMFAQYGSCGEVSTDYYAFESCISKLHSFCIEKEISIGFPYKIGCGLGGGDWDIVYEIIEKYFKDSDTKCYIYKL